MIDVGEKYLISWRNGSKHLGEIIETRPLKRIRESSGDYSIIYLHKTLLIYWSIKK